MNTEDYLAQLRQKDHHIRRCLFVCKQAVLYKLTAKPTESKPNGGQWVNTGVDGMLFLVEREFYPYYALTVFNRASLDEFSKAITDSTKLERIENFVYVSQPAILRSRASASQEEKAAFRGDADGGENENIAFWIPPSATPANNASQLISRLSTVVSYLQIYRPVLTGRLPVVASLLDEAEGVPTKTEQKSSSQSKTSGAPPRSGATSGSQSSLASLLSGRSHLPEDPQVALAEFLTTADTETKSSASPAQIRPTTSGKAGQTPESQPPSSASKKKGGKQPKVSRENFKDFLLERINDEAGLNKLYELYSKNPKAFEL